MVFDSHNSGDEETRMGAKNYVVRTQNGERTWFADDAEHAREQHLDAFGGEPGEDILEVRIPR
jgi:hypothetical protein